MNTALLLILFVIFVAGVVWYAHESSKNAHLRILHALKDAKTPLLGRDICKAAKCWRSTIYVHLDRMTRDGFVIATKDDKARDAAIPLFRYTLSQKGHELLRIIEKCL